MDATLIPIELQGVLVATEDTLSGAIRFVDTRVPVQALLDSTSSGESLSDFLDGFPNVKREHAEAVLLWERNQAGKLLGLERAQ